MTTPVERDLAERLERLAAAVPVGRGQLDPVHRGAVAARHELRMRWLTPLVVLLIIMAIAAIAGGIASSPTFRLDPVTDGPDSTGTSDAPVGMARDGDFALTLRADRRVYAPNEPINAIGTLTYFGNRASVEIHTDSSGPIMYGIREKVFGGIDVGTGSLLMCESSTLAANQPLVETFRKGGSFNGEHPDAAKFRAWFEDEELRLPEGTWHLYAVAEAPCMGGEVTFSLHTEIEIVVSDAPDATPGVPGATDWNDQPVYGGDDIGWMALQVRSQHPTYHVGDAVDLDTWFWFMEGDPKFARPFFQEQEFRIGKVDPEAVDVLAAPPVRSCELTTMAPREERHVPLDEAHVVQIKAGPWPDSSSEALSRGELVLPVGRWRITVTVRAVFGPCGAPEETWEAHASVEFDILP